MITVTHSFIQWCVCVHNEYIYGEITSSINVGYFPIFYDKVISWWLECHFTTATAVTYKMVALSANFSSLR